MARVFLLFSFLLLAGTSFAQIRELPKEVDAAFSKQYPGAEEVEFVDNLINVKVHFVLDDEQYIATYTSKGLWKETEKTWSFDKLSADVKDGFEKCKYADWPVTGAAILYKADKSELYRIKVEKNELLKKYLLFNAKGRLLSESITL
jgi:hypothetical protein